MAGDPNYPLTKLLVHGNGANNGIVFPDHSPHRLTGYAVGGAKTSTAQSKFNGSSIHLPNAGDRVVFPANDNITVIGTAFTVELWVYPTLAGFGYKRYFSNSGPNNLLTIRQSSTTLLEAVMQISAGSAGTQYFAISAGVAATLNEWQHLALTGDGTTIRFFKNGSVKGMEAQPASLFLCSDAAYEGGYVIGSASEPSEGYFAEVSLINGIAKYTAAFTPPTAPPEHYYGRVAGNITESLAINKWAICANRCRDGILSGATISTGAAYSIDCDTIEPCKITLSPHIDYAWTANKVAAIGDYVVASNPDATPHLWIVTSITGDARLGTTEPAYNLYGTTISGNVTLSYISPLVDPVTLGPKIPAQI